MLASAGTQFEGSLCRGVTLDTPRWDISEVASAHRMCFVFL